VAAGPCETLPETQVQTDDEWLDCARRNGGICYHVGCADSDVDLLRFAPRALM
jgi:hypothetical protein